MEKRNLSHVNLDRILSEVAQRVTPKAAERERMSGLAEQFTNQVEMVLRFAGYEPHVSVQGSFARDTWLSGETDLDIFPQFPPSVERKEWTEQILPLLRGELKDYNIIERYAEHPFLEFHVENVRINIVPCYKVKPGEWKSATDRSPYHTEYMKKHLTPSLRLQSRLLRRFAKGIGTYGAEIKIGGFSGMLLETIVLFYGSFLGTVEHVSDWSHSTFIDIEHRPRTNSLKELEKWDAPLVVIDPVDPERNLAAAVRSSKLWSFVEASRQFLKTPGLWYFYPSKPVLKARSKFVTTIRQSGFEIYGIWFKHSQLVLDILWGQLLRLERSIVRILEKNDFQVTRSTLWSNEKNESAIIFELPYDKLSRVIRREGPPVSNKQASEAFLQRHIYANDTVRGPWIYDDAWFVDKKRETFRFQDLIKIMIEDKNYGLVIPSELDSGFRKTWQLRSSDQLVAQTYRKDFNESFWKFIEAKPVWLKPRRTTTSQSQ